MVCRKGKILFIEDSKVDRMIIKQFFSKERLPYDYTLTKSLKEASTILESESFDILVADYLLGAGTAFDIIKKITDIPIILITGFGGKELTQRALKAGFYDCLTKDIEGNYMKTVLAKIEKAIGRKDDTSKKFLAKD